MGFPCEAESQGRLGHGLVHGDEDEHVDDEAGDEQEGADEGVGLSGGKAGVVEAGDAEHHDADDVEQEGQGRRERAMRMTRFHQVRVPTSETAPPRARKAMSMRHAGAGLGDVEGVALERGGVDDDRLVAHDLDLDAKHGEADVATLGREGLEGPGCVVHDLLRDGDREEEVGEGEEGVSHDARTLQQQGDAEDAEHEAQALAQVIGDADDEEEIGPDAQEDGDDAGPEDHAAEAFEPGEVGPEQAAADGGNEEGVDQSPLVIP